MQDIIVLQKYFHKILKLSYCNVKAKAAFCILYEQNHHPAVPCALNIHHMEGKKTLAIFL